MNKQGLKDSTVNQSIVIDAQADLSAGALLKVRFELKCWHALQTELSSVILPDVLLRKELR